ncbi:MAG: sodium/panthothenate symporter [Methanosaeta sp. PtaB.Bin039]|nr:MAG: sodium/panthothenate symporter [Methanosaeta sp. PtaB.Bin039]
MRNDPYHRIWAWSWQARGTDGCGLVISMDISTLSVLLLYLLCTLLLGAWAGRGRRSLLDFVLSGRELRGFWLTGTLCATILGASSTLGMAGLGFSRGLPGAWWLLSGVIGLLALSILLAARIREKANFTLPDLVGSFYGQPARDLAAVLIVTSWVGLVAAQIVASGKVLGVLFSGQETLFMILSTAVFVLYTMHGGQRSVVRTDLLQFAIIVLGIAVLAFRSWQSAALPAYTVQFPTSPSMGPAAVLSMVFLVGSTYLVGPDIYSRILSAKDPKTARRSAMTAAVVLIPLAFLIAMLGVWARALHPEIAPEQSIPVLMMDLLSPAARGLVAAALLAAFMSSADTMLITISSILSMDLYRQMRPHASDEELISISRLSVLATGIAALAVAISSPGIIATLMTAYTVFAGGLVVPVIAGFWRQRLGLSSRAAILSMLVGGGAALLFGGSYPLAGMGSSAMVVLLCGIASRLSGRNRAGFLKEE